MAVVKRIAKSFHRTQKVKIIFFRPVLCSLCIGFRHAGGYIEIKKKKGMVAKGAISFVI